MRLLLCLLFFVPVLSFAQPAPDLTAFKTSKEKLKAWSDYCDELIDIEDYKKLRTVGWQGVAMTPYDDPYNKSLFTFYIAVTFNYSTESDSAIYYLNQSEQYGRESKVSRRITEALKQLLNVSNTVGNVAVRQRALDSLLRVIDTTQSDKLKRSIRESVADYYITNGQYEKGMSYQLQGLSNRRDDMLKTVKKTDSINYAVMLINIGELYSQMKQPQKAIEYLRASETYIIDYQEGIAHLYKDLLDAFLLEQKIDSAEKYYRQLNDYVKKGDADVNYTSLIAADLAFAEHYLTEKKYPRALFFVDHAAALAPKYADVLLAGEVNYMNGKTNLAVKSYDKALRYLQAAEPALQEGRSASYSSLQQALAETHAALGNWKDAYEHFKIYSGLQDTLLTETAKRNLAEMEAQFQNKNKQQQIDGLSAENTIKNLEIKNAHRQRIYFIVGLILLFGIIISMIAVYRNKQKSSRLLQQKNDEMNLLNENLEKANITKAKLFSIISHDLRNPISQVYQFLDLQKTNPDIFSEEDKRKHNEQISAAAGVVLETMEDLLIWSKTQMQQFNITNENVMLHETVKNIAELLDTQLAKRKLTLTADIDPAVAIHTDRNILAIIIRNILQNAITYSPEHGRVTIIATKQENRTIIRIADEGAGMPERIRRIFNEPSMAINSSQSGLGLTIVKEMADLIGAEIEIRHNQPAGTVLEIRL